MRTAAVSASKAPFDRASDPGLQGWCRISGGPALEERLRESEERYRLLFEAIPLPVVVWESSQVSEFVTGGGHALLSKPFTLKELGRKVRATLDDSKRGSGDASA